MKVSQNRIGTFTRLFIGLITLGILLSDTQNAAAYYSPEHGRFISRDPIGYNSGDPNLYAYVGGHPLIKLDPSGREEIPFDDYWALQVESHPDWNAAKREILEQELSRGCIGITCLALGRTDPNDRKLPDMRDCYFTLDEAETSRDARNCNVGGPRCPPIIFSVHLWVEEELQLVEGRNVVDVTPWTTLDNLDRRRPPGDWNRNQGHGVTYDFGLLVELVEDVETVRVLHADLYHNPDRDGDGIGDFHPMHEERNATVKVKTVDQWRRNNSDFNTEIWCVACQREDRRATR